MTFNTQTIQNDVINSLKAYGKVDQDNVKAGDKVVIGAFYSTTCQVPVQLPDGYSQADIDNIHIRGSGLTIEFNDGTKMEFDDTGYLAPWENDDCFKYPYDIELMSGEAKYYDDDEFIDIHETINN